MRRTWLMPFQVEKTRLNGKYFSISAAGVFTPNLSVNVQHGTSTGHDSAPSRPKFPSTAVVPMASSIPKDKATGHGAWRHSQGVAQGEVITPGQCAKYIRITYPLGNHRITEGFVWIFQVRIEGDEYHSAWSGMIMPLPEKRNMTEICRNRFRLHCFHAPILPAATFQRQKTHWCPACHQRFELRRRHRSWHKDFIQTCSTTFNTFVFCNKRQTFASPQRCTWFRWNAAHSLQPHVKMCRRVTREQWKERAGEIRNWDGLDLFFNLQYFFTFSS